MALQIPLLIRTRSRRKTAKTLRLTLAPYPARIGGKVAGRIVLGEPVPAGTEISVDINCIPDSRSRSSSPLVLWRRRAVVLAGDTLTIIRHFFRKRFAHQVNRKEVHGIEKRISTQTDQGAHSEIEYAIRLNTRDGRSLNVGDGITGDSNVDLIIDFLVSRLSNEPADGRRFDEPPPPWVKPFVLGLASIGVPLFIGAILALIADRPH